MRLNILIGGKAGQGINSISNIVSKILTNQGYFIFNNRDYQSIIRGGHNFNLISISDSKVQSYNLDLDVVVALDDNTLNMHKKKLKKGAIIISYHDFEEKGKNLNVSLAAALVKVLGIDKKIFIKYVKNRFGDQSVLAATNAYHAKHLENIKKSFSLKPLKNKISILSGTQAIAEGAIKSNLDLYIAYPMTPATGVLHNLAAKQVEKNFTVFQAENEISVINTAIGASFTGSKVMVGTSGGGFDLMTEGLSFQGQCEVPLVVYLAQRPGPGTGIPTYTSQGDLNVALRGGHGEFPRVVIAPGDPIECIEKTNEAFYLSQKFNSLSIVLSDKHLAESEFSFNKITDKPNKAIKFKTKNQVGKKIVKINSYEHDSFGNTTEDASIARKNGLARLKKYQDIKKECQRFEMIKIHGKKSSKNLIISWGSNKGAILDAIKGEDFKFLQVLYMSPMSDKIKSEINKANKIILVEQNLTGQLGRLIREKTGIKIKHRILKFDGRAFTCDGLKKQLQNELKKK